MIFLGSGVRKLIIGYSVGDHSGESLSGLELCSDEAIRGNNMPNVWG